MAVPFSPSADDQKPMGNLVLTRKLNEIVEFVIGHDSFLIEVVGLSNYSAKILVHAPETVHVFRRPAHWRRAGEDQA